MVAQHLAFEVAQSRHVRGRRKFDLLLVFCPSTPNRDLSENFFRRLFDASGGIDAVRADAEPPTAPWKR
jgi:hypothetical protein